MLEELGLAISRALATHQRDVVLGFLFEPSHPQDKDFEGLTSFSEKCLAAAADDGIGFDHAAALWTSGVPVVEIKLPPDSRCSVLAEAFFGSPSDVVAQLQHVTSNIH